jgi:error-prone DNA polymerase
MQDLPRHLGQHSGGMVICQGRLDSVVPLENASMPGRIVIQWDKDDCADMGIVKVDLLGLGMMAVIQDAISLVNRPGFGTRDPGFRGAADQNESRIPNLESREILDLAHLPPDDPDVYRMMQEADTIGLFQVESRAQMATLPRMKPDHFYDLVVQVAIIRPGPIVGQMVHPYLNRRAGREPVTYAHPSLEPILKRTLGVPLFQEQLLRMAMVTAGFSGGQAEDLRRAFGFKRSERRMKQVEVKLREGMAAQGITGDAAEQIISSITAFALYGFPESHAASFALLSYASGYLKVHFPSAFYTALLNNQPMGFYSPATLVKDAQRRGVRFAGVDVQHSDWLCKVDPDGSIRLGLRYVTGLREEVGKAVERAESREQRAEREQREQRAQGRDSGLGIRDSSHPSHPSHLTHPSICPKCGCDDESMLEVVRPGSFFCNTCSYDWGSPKLAGNSVASEGGHPSHLSHRFSSVDDLVQKTGARREELQMLAEIGAFASFGYERREALWQVEKAVRPAGELFQGAESGFGIGDSGFGGTAEQIESPIPSPEARPSTNSGRPELAEGRECPLPPMTAEERLVADYAGTHLTIGPHPMAMRRGELAMRGVLRASDLPRARDGRRIRVAGSVITRQRPGTAKGFVFLTLEDETGIANIIIRPDLFDRERFKILEEPFLLIDGVLQNQEGVTSIKADRVHGLGGVKLDFESHDFH